MTDPATATSPAATPTAPPTPTRATTGAGTSSSTTLPPVMPRRRFMGLDPNSRWISLLWAAPFMVFLLIPLVAAVQHGRGTATGRTVIIGILLLGGTYIATWLSNPVAPRGPEVTRAFVVSFGALIATTVAWLALPLVTEVTTAGYMLSYLMAAWCMLSPRQLLLPGFWIIAVVSVLDSLLVHGEQIYAIATVVMTGIVCSMSRASIDHGQRERIDHRRALELSEERERTRISADLHDILGQTLTAISVKADLAGRLMDAGRSPEARREVADLQAMARQALTDVRAVVASNRTLLPGTELASAHSLLEAAGVRLDVTRDGGEPAPGAPATLVAHVIREGTTNALAHSDCRHLWVRVGADGVEIVNDGCGRRADSGHEGAGGSGLVGLRERAAGIGSLTWGPDPDHADRWRLTLTLHPLA